MARFIPLALAAFAAVAAGAAAGAAGKGSKKETKSALKADLAQAQEHVVELTAELRATTVALNDARASRDLAIESLETVSAAAASSSSSSGLPLLSWQQMLDTSAALQTHLLKVAETPAVRGAFAAASATANLGFEAAARGVEVAKKAGAKTCEAATAAVTRALAHNRVAPLITRAQEYQVGGRPLTTVVAEAREVAGAVQAKAARWLEIAQARAEFAITVARFWVAERAMPVLAAQSQPMLLSVARGSVVPSLTLAKFETDADSASEETWVRVRLQHGAVDLFLGLLQCLFMSAGVVGALSLAQEIIAVVLVQPLVALVGLALRLVLGALMLVVSSVHFVWFCYTAVLCCCCRRRRRKAALAAPAKAANGNTTNNKIAKAAPAKASSSSKKDKSDDKAQPVVSGKVSKNAKVPRVSV